MQTNLFFLGMGYTHYWYILNRLNLEPVARDFKKAVELMEKKGLELAGGLGKGEPEITNQKICFNGVENCGHKKVDLGIAWAADNAHGVDFNNESVNRDEDWFAGRLLNARMCGGDCSHETFLVESDSKGFHFCKTAYKPYDFAVNVALIMIKHYNSNSIRIRSDGHLEQWKDAIEFTEHFFGYGSDFKFEEFPEY